MSNKFICKKCGKCCMSLNNAQVASQLDDGSGVCRYYDPTSKLCKIYDKRPLICNVEEAYSLFQSIMSYDEYIDMNYTACEYIRRIEL